MLASGVRMSCARSAVNCDSRWKLLSSPASIAFSDDDERFEFSRDARRVDSRIELVEVTLAALTAISRSGCIARAHEKIAHAECQQHAEHARQLQLVAVTVQQQPAVVHVARDDDGRDRSVLQRGIDGERANRRAGGGGEQRDGIASVIWASRRRPRAAGMLSACGIAGIDVVLHERRCRPRPSIRSDSASLPSTWLSAVRDAANIAVVGQLIGEAARMPRREHDVEIVLHLDLLLQREVDESCRPARTPPAWWPRTPARASWSANAARITRRLPASMHIADAAHGLNQFDGEVVVDLRAQSADRDFDHVGVAVEVHVPHIGRDLRAAQYFALPAREQLQQREFARREIDALAARLTRRARVTSISRSPSTMRSLSRGGPRRASERTRASSSTKANGLTR